MSASVVVSFYILFVIPSSLFPCRTQAFILPGVISRIIHRKRPQDFVAAVAANFLGSFRDTIAACKPYYTRALLRVAAHLIEADRLNI